MTELSGCYDESIHYVDHRVGEFLSWLDADPAFRNSLVVITSDHGELFGEDDYFGHGPVMHRKCFEVPFVEGLRP